VDKNAVNPLQNALVNRATLPSSGHPSRVRESDGFTPEGAARRRPLLPPPGEGVVGSRLGPPGPSAGAVPRALGHLRAAAGAGSHGWPAGDVQPLHSHERTFCHNYCIYPASIFNSRYIHIYILKIHIWNHKAFFRFCFVLFCIVLVLILVEVIEEKLHCFGTLIHRNIQRAPNWKGQRRLQSYYREHSGDRRSWKPRQAPWSHRPCNEGTSA